MTPANVKEAGTKLAAATKGVDADAFRRCMDQGMSVGLVLKDLNLAEANQVNATPTIFVNGHRLQGAENKAKLREVIAEARKEAGERAEKGATGAPASPIVPGVSRRDSSSR